MYRGLNPTALQSQEWIRVAFLKLLVSKPLKKITINEICKRAGLARQTFYKLFDSKEEILEFHLDLLFQEYFQEIQKTKGINIQQFAFLFFEFFKNNRKFISHLIDNDTTSILLKKFRDYLPELEKLTKFKSADKSVYNYELAFISGALVEILIYWFKDDLRASPHNLSVLIQYILEGKLFTPEDNSLCAFKNM